MSFNHIKFSALTSLVAVAFQVVIGATEVRAAEPILAPFVCNHDQLRQEFYPEDSVSSLAEAQACLDISLCGDPFFRDLWRVNPAPPITYVRVIFHVIREDDGSNPAATMGLVDSQMVQLNEDFLPSGIQFIYTARFVDSSYFRIWDNSSFFNLTEMKEALFIDPHLQLNIIVTKLVPGPSGASNPDKFDPYGFDGGVAMSTNSSVQQFISDMRRHTMTHEFGHIFGQVHPSAGIDTYPCNFFCTENLTTGATNYNGDQISETPPQPGWGGSTFAGAGNDPCSGLPWPVIANDNYMNFGNTSKTTFTPQQSAKMRCYLNNQMSNWVMGVTFSSGDPVPLFGADSLEVSFTSESDITVNQWSWSFGDGDSAFISDPTHMFGPGLHTVTAEIDTDSGVFAYQHGYYVAVHSDSVIAGDAKGLRGESVRVDLYARNYISVTSMWIPFIWSGPLDITFDSGSVAGLRTDGLNLSLVNIDPSNKRGRFAITSVADIPIAPGSGPVLSLYFTLPDALGPTPAPISIQKWSNNDLIFFTKYGSGNYAPTGLGGTLSIDCCSNAGDADDGGDVNIGDATFIVKYVFQGGAAPSCCDQADADGGGSVNIGDATSIVKFVFQGGTAPVCPNPGSIQCL